MYRFNIKKIPYFKYQFLFTFFYIILYCIVFLHKTTEHSISLWAGKIPKAKKYFLLWSVKILVFFFLIVQHKIYLYEILRDPDVKLWIFGVFSSNGFKAKLRILDYEVIWFPPYPWFTYSICSGRSFISLKFYYRQKKNSQ